jgi:alpha-tubulin suppressor-like RCC1 family protein
MAKVPTAVYVEAGAAKRRLRVMSVAAGTWHSLVLAEDNAVYSFGRCQYVPASHRIPRRVFFLAV